MIIKKTAELCFTNNDIYILEVSNNAIIVNNNYEGILVFDNSLRIQNEITILQEAPIYFLYKEYSNKALIFYLPDDNRIIFLDLKTFAKCVIQLPESFNEEVLLPNYYWKDDILIFTTTHNVFYQLNFISKKLNKISPDEVQNFCWDFFDFWSVCKKYNILTLYPSQKSFIFEDDNHDLSFFNYQKNKETIVADQPAKGWHDVEYYNGMLLFVYEKKIEILYDQFKNILISRTNFIFLKAKFLHDNIFVVLSGDPSNSQESLLEIYYRDDE